MRDEIKVNKWFVLWLQAIGSHWLSEQTTGETETDGQHNRQHNRLQRFNNGIDVNREYGSRLSWSQLCWVIGVQYKRQLLVKDVPKSHNHLKRSRLAVTPSQRFSDKANHCSPVVTTGGPQGLASERPSTAQRLTCKVVWRGRDSSQCRVLCLEVFPSEYRRWCRRRT